MDTQTELYVVTGPNGATHSFESIDAIREAAEYHWRFAKELEGAANFAEAHPEVRDIPPAGY